MDSYDSPLSMRLGSNPKSKQTNHPHTHSQVDKLRQWRQDALVQHQYKTAEFVGDKILTLTDDINDAYWLAKVHFASGNYGRAHNILTSRQEFGSSLQCRYLAGLSLCNMGQWENALEVIGESNQSLFIQESIPLPHPPSIPIPISKSTKTRPISTTSTSTSVSNSTSTSSPSSTPFSSTSTSTPFSSSSSAAAARSAIPLIIKSTIEPSFSNPILPNPPSLSIPSPSSLTSLTSTNAIKIEASLCFLRGKIYTNDNNFDRAKECYREAVQIDAKCYEAFDQLITNNLITPQEEWDLLKSLDFEKSAGHENAELVKALYSVRLGKYINLSAYKESENLLNDHYGLGQNPDILSSQADMLFVQNRYKECLKICERILSYDKYKFSILPNYLACLYQLGSRNKLFQLSHELIASNPQEPVSWQAVGVYYMVIGKITEARRYFSKASMMNPYFAPAWIGFAHTFASEKEHEQAISAYSTAARLFPGSHLPTLFLGMQHLQLGNISIAEDYLATSYAICKADPTLLNEMGVVYFEKRDYDKAETFFLKAIAIVSELDSDPKSWISIKTNLGHVYRKMENFDKSLEYFEQVLRISPKDASTHTSMGLVNLMVNQTMQAINNFNDALSISPGDPIASDLLKKALVQHSDSLELAIDDDEFAFDLPELKELVDPDYNDSQMDIEQE